jgi:hypothetical protein
MGSIIARHNSKLLRSAAVTLPRRQPHCNCQKKQECPVPGMCNNDGTVYQATVTSAGGGVETYVGLAKNFKKRYPKHKKNCWWNLQLEAPHYRNTIGRRNMQARTQRSHGVFWKRMCL